jgi:hypothetical protein
MLLIVRVWYRGRPKVVNLDSAAPGRDLAVWAAREQGVERKRTSNAHTHMSLMASSF